MIGEFIPFSNLGVAYEGYLALPERATGLGIIVLHDRLGPGVHIWEVTDRLAKLGFVALAPALLCGSVSIDDISGVRQILAESVRILRARPEITKPKVGVLGFGMGGQLAMLAASLDLEIGACVNFYGFCPGVEVALENLNAPMLGIFGEDDLSIPFSAVEELDKQLTALGKTHVFHLFEGVGYGFYDDSRPEFYDAVQAAEAWDNTLKFLVKHLFYRAS